MHLWPQVPLSLGMFKWVEDRLFGMDVSWEVRPFMHEFCYVYEILNYDFDLSFFHAFNLL